MFTVWGLVKRSFSLLMFVITFFYSLFGYVFTDYEAYTQAFAAVNTDGFITTFQTGSAYSETINLPADSVMVYTLDPTAYSRWVSHRGRFEIDMMIAVNRADTSYVGSDPVRRGEIQVNSDGEIMTHPSSDSVFYMVPSQGLVNDICAKLEACIDVYAPRMIALEEPELFADTGYSDAFKAEWKAFYGSDWIDPKSSAEANWKSSELKVALFERAITEISRRVKAKSPDTLIFIASHSTINYKSYGIISGLDRYAALDGVDGVIGQTWSDTARHSFRYSGKKTSDTFSYSFLEYSSYPDTVEGKDFYALADPKADDASFGWDEYEEEYKHTVVASLMQPEIHKFELFPWPERSFAAAPDDYRTEQLNVFSALRGISGAASEITAGTPKISFALADSYSWQSDEFTIKSEEALEGLTLSLIRAGIPLKIKSLDNIRSAADLADTELLILSYEIMKPSSEQANIAIADWVKAGGTVLYIGGHDKYEYVDGTWWSELGQTPLTNLMSNLGIRDIRVTTPQILGAYGFAWEGKAAKMNSLKTFELSLNMISSIYNGTTAAFEGMGCNSILKAGGYHLGIDQPAGDGHFLAFSFPAILTSRSWGDEMMNYLVEYALSYTDVNYSRSDSMLARRGSYVAAHAFNDELTLDGKYINMFSSALDLSNGFTLGKNESALLLDISATDLSVPRLAATGGILLAPAAEAANKTEFSLTGPLFADMSSRLLCADGTYPQSVTVSRNGESVPAALKWDAENDSLLICFEGAQQTAQVTVIWGEAPVDISSASPVRRTIIPTNNMNLDTEYLLRCNAGANTVLRFADVGTEIVYRFDLSEFSNPTFSFSVSQNYLIDVSTNDADYTVTHNYSILHPEHLTTGGNDLIVTFDPDDFGAEDYFYVRIRNTDTSKGWGGSVSQIVIREH